MNEIYFISIIASASPAVKDFIAFYLINFQTTTKFLGILGDSLAIYRPVWYF